MRMRRLVSETRLTPNKREKCGNWRSVHVISSPFPSHHIQRHTMCAVGLKIAIQRLASTLSETLNDLNVRDGLVGGQNSDINIINYPLEANEFIDYARKW